jgi:hypothetical protein
VVSVEKGDRRVSRRVVAEVDAGLQNWNDFLNLYKDWLKRTEMEMPGSQWQRFKFHSFIVSSCRSGLIKFRSTFRVHDKDLLSKLSSSEVL